MAPKNARILHRWLDFMESMDLEGLLDLYAPDAVIESPGGERYSRSELEDRLPFLRKVARKMRLGAVRVYGSGLITIVDGPLGAKQYWNRFQSDGHRIHRHTIDLLDGESLVPAAS